MGLFKYLISLIIDYIRWTQMAPMVLAWAFLLFTLLAMTVINFQQASFTFLEWLVGLWDRYEWLPEWDTSEAEQDDGSLHITDDNLRPLILKGWAVLSLVLFVIDLLRTSLTGPREPSSLRRRLLIAAGAAGLVTLGFLLNYWFGSETYNGGPFGWVMLFIGGPLIVWIISAYSLSVSHVLTRVNGHIMADRDDNSRHRYL